MSCDIVLIFPPIRTWDNPRNFPTGIGLIAAELKQKGYRVKVIDANGSRLSDQDVLAKIKACNPAVIGIGGLITTYRWVKRLSRQIRQLWPDRPIILGGSVGTSIIETALKNLTIDIITVTEADRTILELLPALLNNEKIDNIAGLAYLQDGRVIQTPDRPLIENLDELPLPQWEMFPMDVYLANPVVGVGKDIDIISSRGCPFTCRYCYRIFGRQFRGRSAEHVVGEIEALKAKYDVDFISFQDDCFVIDKNRVYEICDLMDKMGLSRLLRWSCTGRVTICDVDMLRRMRTSGCVSVSYGIESGSDAILKAMGKNASMAKAKQAITNTRDAGLRCPVSFMIGYPGETRQTVMETVAFCKELNIPLSALMFTCPYPGTALYQQVKDTQQFKQQFADEEDFVLKIGDAVDFTANMTEINNDSLLELRTEALQIAKQNYQPLSKEQIDAQERELYGEELYQKAKQQMQSPQMQAHRKRHGFNEPDAKNTNDKPGWLTGRIAPYIIAEAGVNHNGQLKTAMCLVDAAKNAGADCVKFQAFTADQLTVRQAPKANYQKQSGKPNESQNDMLRRYELTEDDLAAIMKYCNEKKIEFLATPFSVQWVKTLTDMGVNAIKIGSGNIKWPELLEAVGQTALPVIASTGMSDMNDVDDMLSRLRAVGCKNIAVLHCVSLYPTKLKQANLAAIGTLKQHTGLAVGFSDHTRETITGALAVVAGSVILEKHLTLDKNLEGPDHKMSLTPREFKNYVELAKQAWLACGNGKKEPLPQELEVSNAVRMSVVTTTEVKKGEKFTRDNTAIKRPGTGIPANEINSVVGSAATHDIPADYILQKKDIKR